MNTHIRGTRTQESIFNILHERTAKKTNHIKGRDGAAWIIAFF